MWIENRMNKAVICIGKDETIETAISLLHEKNIRHLPVVDGGKLVGIISDRDLRPFKFINLNEFKKVMKGLCVKDIMKENVITAKPNNTFEYASFIMRQNKIGALPVTDDNGKVLGIITEADILDTYLKVLGAFIPSSLLEIEAKSSTETVEKVCRVAREMSNNIISLFTIPEKEANKTIIAIRLSGKRLEDLVYKLEHEGLKILSVTTSV